MLKETKIVDNKAKISPGPQIKTLDKFLTEIIITPINDKEM